MPAVAGRRGGAERRYPLPQQPGSGGSSGIAAYSEQAFLAGGWEEVRDRVGPHWWATMRLAGRAALHRSAVHLTRGSVPSMRALLLDLTIPRTYLLPEADGPLPGADALAAAGVAVVAIPDCGHNIMLDNPEAFTRATAAAFADQSQGQGQDQSQGQGQDQGQGQGQR